jgi:hypothetical protein
MTALSHSNEQQLEVRRLATHPNRDFRIDLRAGHDGGQGASHLLERFGGCRSQAPHADIGIMWKCSHCALLSAGKPEPVIIRLNASRKHLQGKQQNTSLDLAQT